MPISQNEMYEMTRLAYLFTRRQLRCLSLSIPPLRTLDSNQKKIRFIAEYRIQSLYKPPLRTFETLESEYGDVRIIGCPGGQTCCICWKIPKRPTELTEIEDSSGLSPRNTERVRFPALFQLAAQTAQLPGPGRSNGVGCDRGGEYKRG